VEFAGEIQGPVADVPEQVPVPRCGLMLHSPVADEESKLKGSRDSGFFGQLIR